MADEDRDGNGRHGEDRDGGGLGSRAAVLALVVVVVLVLAGWWISGALRSGAAVQDCVMQGRSNCAPIHH